MSQRDVSASWVLVALMLIGVGCHSMIQAAGLTGPQAPAAYAATAGAAAADDACR